jgi:hypothetical protein
MFVAARSCSGAHQHGDLFEVMLKAARAMNSISLAGLDPGFQNTWGSPRGLKM